MLKISQPGTDFSKLVQAYLSLTPHSIGPEWAVSCHTIIKGPKQSSYSREAINSRMYIALNSGGLHISIQGMEYVFRAKGPALGPARSFSA